MKKAKFSNYLKTYFTFSKGERNGILVLLVILLIVIVSIFGISRTPSNNSKVDYTAFKNEIDSLFVEDSVKTIKKEYYSSKSDTFHKSKSKPILVELNSSDSSELTKLSGIGPVFASRILKYRKLLGGFYQINQLQEVYGLKEETIQKIKDHITINTKLITGIVIDTASFRTLVRHPYIGKDRTLKIINLRKKINPLKDKDLLSAGVFDSIQWHKVKPYLVFQSFFN
jgi:competence ComEA-like helix-hairpin-helix protein